VFFPHLVARRETAWERGDEPQTRWSFVDAYDRYGQPTAACAIAPPRAAGEPYLATRTETALAQRDDEARYRVDAVARTQSFEILNDGTATVDALHRAIVDGSQPRRLIAETRHHYDGAPFEGLPLGQLGDVGALVRSEALALTADLVAAAYGDAPPPYLGDPSPSWPAEIPPGFGAMLAPGAGYVARDGGLYVATDRCSYDVQRDPGGRGLLEARRDPLGRVTETSYDAARLLPQTLTDAAGLVTTIASDARLLLPASVTEPNGNTTLSATVRSACWRASRWSTRTGPATGPMNPVRPSPMTSRPSKSAGSRSPCARRAARTTSASPGS
jgi:hypothetical protein